MSRAAPMTRSSSTSTSTPATTSARTRARGQFLQRRRPTTKGLLSWVDAPAPALVGRGSRERGRGAPTRALEGGNEITDDDDSDATDDSETPRLREMLRMIRERRAADVSTTPQTTTQTTTVWLVGTGPGDPGLLTLRAYQLMQSADVVLYDRLVSNEILNLVRREATMVYVGKRSGFHTRTQEEIHELLSAFASAGATILRLKGGDPLVFGRGGEELDFLREKNPDVRVEVVPGVTAAAGVGSELGIPLTHRGVSTSVRLLTGHLREGATSDPVDFAVTSADVETTLVVYMGLGTLPRLRERLLEGGFPGDMPAVAIERGTTKKERRVFSTLEHLPEAATATELVSPTLLIIGKTVTLSPHWPPEAVASDKWVEQRGSPRGDDADDWKVWLDVDLEAAVSKASSNSAKTLDVDVSSSRSTFRQVHADSAL